MTTTVLAKYAQVISVDLMQALKSSAVEHGVALDVEIATRLTAFMAEPEITQDNALSQQILRKQFTEMEAVAECKRKREATLYSYEMGKLRHFLINVPFLPRNIKETYTTIDVKAATKVIEAELAQEAKNKGKSKFPFSDEE